MQKLTNYYSTFSPVLQARKREKQRTCHVFRRTILYCIINILYFNRKTEKSRISCLYETGRTWYSVAGGITMYLTESDILLFSGDSITDGNRGHTMDCNHIMGHGYQTIVAGTLALENAQTQPKFVNKGYSGATMGDLLKKWQQDVLDNHPTLVSLLAGVNDGMRGLTENRTAEQIAERYRRDLRGAIDLTFRTLGRIPFVLLEPFYLPLDRTDVSYRYVPHPLCEADRPRPDAGETAETTARRVESMTRMQRAARETAAEYGCIFIELQKPFEQAAARSRREYFTWDGTHPTITGHALIAGLWLDSVRGT